MPARIRRRAKTPRERVGARKCCGPERTVTLCEDWLRQRQVTTVPRVIRSVGPSRPRTKTPRLQSVVAGARSGASEVKAMTAP
ncbi:MAG: hypothetical protein ACXWZZ_02775 [Solirubrobacteraceae bacterium]